MPKRTIQQVIEAAKQGDQIAVVEYHATMLALYSMLTRSRMMLETIADKIDNPESLYYTSRAFLGSIETVCEERRVWMGTIPSEWLKQMEEQQKQVDLLFNGK